MEKFQKIKNKKKIKSALASEFEFNKKSMRKKAKTKRDERKSKWNIEPVED